MTDGQQIATFAQAVRQSSLKRFNQVHSGDEEWRPHPELLSFVDVLKHLVDADRWLLGSLVGGSVQRPVVTPGCARAANWNGLLTQLIELGQKKVAFLRGLKRAQLEAKIVEPHVLGETTWWWLIVRGNLDHEIHHRGALQLALRLKYG